MTVANRIALVSVEEYLAGELTSDVKHEYSEGYVYGRAETKTVHNRIAMSCLLALGQQLTGKPCEAFNSDMKVRVQLPTHTRFYYPDGMVVCEPNPPESSFQDRPAVIFEVVSEATRRIDEGEKREAYLSISTLSAYLLVETDQPRVVVYRRASQGFEPEAYEGLAAVIPLDAIGIELELKDIYQRVGFPGL